MSVIPTPVNAAQPATPATPAPTGTAQPITSAQEALGSYTATAVEATTPAEIKASTYASAKIDDSPNVFHFTKKVRWNGENYILKLDFPCENWKQVQTANPDEFKASTEEYADLFYADLIQTLEKNDKIKPGDNFEVLFHEENGYTVFVAPPGFDPYTASEETLAQVEKKVVAGSDQSKTLSTIIASLPDNDCTYPRMLHTKLLGAKALQQLRQTVTKQRTEAAKTLAPIPLQNNGATCFLNAAFQQLVNDQSLVDELSKPENFVRGENNGLYCAIQAYRQHQASGNTNPLNIARYFPGIDTGEQQDPINDAWDRFGEFLNLEDANLSAPRLKALFQRPAFGITANASLDTLATQAYGAQNSSSFPEVMNLRVTDRVQVTGRELAKDLSETDKIALGTYLEDQRNQFSDGFQAIISNQCPENFQDALSDQTDTEARPTPEPQSTSWSTSIWNMAASLVSSRPKHEIQAPVTEPSTTPPLATQYTEEQYTSLADIVLQNANLRAEVLQQLAENTPLRIAIQRCLRPVVEKNNDELDVKSEMVTVAGTQYQITSFIEHIGTSANSGHCVTYIQKDGKYYKLNDLSKTVESITPQAFIAAAKRAVCYTLHKEGLLVTKPAAPVSTPPQAQNEVIANTKHTIDNTSTTFSVEEGEMRLAGQGFTLVHPSNEHLKTIHPQMESILETNFNTAIKAAKEGDKTWRNLNGKLKSKVLSTHNPEIYHVRTKNGQLTEQEVKKAVADVLQYAQEHNQNQIAFPVLDADQDQVIDWMRTAITDFIQKSTSWTQGHVKIIVPKTTV